MADSDITKMKVADLKRELKNRGLSTGGNKNDLVERLQNALIDGGSVDGGENQSHISDDLLDDELDDDLDEKDLLQDDHEDELLNPSPITGSKKLTLKLSTKPQATVTATANGSEAKAAAPAKKVSLKRNLQIQTPVLEKVDEPEEKGEEKQSDTSSSLEPPKKISKIAELSAAERRKIRLQKFGDSIPTVDLVAEDEKKAARAARFGITATVSNVSSKFSAASITTSSGTPELEKLQKRAERFGATTSVKLSEVELQERLKKRQERFGAGSAEDKLQKRAERFKAAA